MRTLSLAYPAVVTLNGSGNGTAQAGPRLAGEAWYPTSVSISMTGSQPTTVATCYIYAGGGVSPATFVDATYAVLAAASSLISGQTLYPGQSVYAVWTGGNPDAVGTLVVNGTRTVP